MENWVSGPPRPSCVEVAYGRCAINAFATVTITIAIVIAMGGLTRRVLIRSANVRGRVPAMSSNGGAVVDLICENAIISLTR